MGRSLAEFAAGVTKGAAPAQEPEVITPLAKTTKEDKLKILKAVEAQLNKQFSTTNSLVRLGSRVGVPLPSIATNLPTVDYDVIGTGGIPRGRVIEIFGPESAGKTTVTLHIIAQEQAYQEAHEGLLTAFVDAEHALDPNYAKSLGVNVNDLMISQPDSGEQALETVKSLVESRVVSLIVVDSVAALVPQAELDGEMGDSHMGLQARLMSQAMRKLRGVCSQHSVTVIFINQIREKIGVMFGNPETTTGGRALKFYASLRLDVRRKEPIKSGDVQIGHEMKIKAVKNKVGTPLRETLVKLIYGKGIDIEADLITYAVGAGAIEKAGAWYKVNGENIGNGLDKTIENLKSKPELLAVVRAEVAKARAAQLETDAQ